MLVLFFFFFFVRAVFNKTFTCAAYELSPFRPVVYNFFPVASFSERTIYHKKYMVVLFLEVTTYSKTKECTTQ